MELELSQSMNCWGPTQADCLAHTNFSGHVVFQSAASWDGGPSLLRMFYTFWISAYFVIFWWSELELVLDSRISQKVTLNIITFNIHSFIHSEWFQRIIYNDRIQQTMHEAYVEDTLREMVNMEGIRENQKLWIWNRINKCWVLDLKSDQ